MKQQSGYSLIEIMIGLLIGLIVVAATVNIYISTVGSSSATIKSSRLNHDLDAVMTLMINDIKRAGFWGGARVDADSRTNPFTAATTTVQIPANTCILYSYDADGDAVPDANEFYGFKLESNTIKIRKTGAATADCVNDGSWEEFIDGTQLTITTLQFSFDPVDVNADGDVLDGIDLPAASRCLNVSTNTPLDDLTCADTAAAGESVGEKRVVNIQLSGRLSSDNNVTKTINGTVEIRNSRLRLI